MNEKIMSQLTEYVSSLELVTWYKIYLYQNTQLLYPAEEESADRPLLTDRYLAGRLLELEGIVLDQDEPSVFYHVCHFEGDVTFVTGPFSIMAAQKKIQQDYCIRHGLRDKFSFPVKKASRQQVLAAQFLIDSFMEQQGFSRIRKEAAMPDLPEEPLADKKDMQYQEYLLESAALKIPHGTYLLEQRLDKAMISGNRQEVFALLNEFQKYQTSYFTKSPEKAAEYSAVMMITYFTRDAIQAGVPEPDAYALSDYLLMELSGYHKKEDYIKKTEDAINRFLKMILQHRADISSPPVISRCKSYILQNLHQPLTTSVIADAVGVSTSHLQHLFSESTGITLMNFVRFERLKAAAGMLRFSDYSVTKIADYYQFKSQSHFCAAFKKQFGVTPLQYKEQDPK